MTLDSIVGQDRAIGLLRHALRSGRIAHAYLFTGAPGVGKMTTAVEFAKALVCAHPAKTGDACGRCSHCQKIGRGIHPDIYRVEPGGKGRLIPIGVFRVRETGDGLLKDLSLKPNEAARKIVLIDDAHAMNDEAQNCLLKTLEEPDEHSVFLLVTPRPDALSETILSRCQIIRFALLRPDDIVRKLEEGGVDHATALFLARSAGGSLSRAQQMIGETDLPKNRRDLLDLLASADETTIVGAAAQVTKLVRDLAAARTEWAATSPLDEQENGEPAQKIPLSVARSAAEWLLDLALLFYRDVALRQLGVGLERLPNADLPALLQAETAISPAAIRTIIDTIEEAKGLIRSNVDVEAVILDTVSRIAGLRARRAALAQKQATPRSGS